MRLRHDKTLITGKPGVGKTTLIENIVERMRSVNMVGFYTSEIRSKGSRLGFELQGVDGKSLILAHVDIDGRPHVGKYRVDTEGFERFLQTLDLGGGDSITYLGHGTLYIRLTGINILTDPIFEDINFFFRRFVPFPLPPEALPPMQVVLISHSHLDHLDVDSIRRLGSTPLYLAPLGYRDWFEDVVPGAKVVELDWFQTYTYEGSPIGSYRPNIGPSERPLTRTAASGALGSSRRETARFTMQLTPAIFMGLRNMGKNSALSTQPYFPLRRTNRRASRPCAARAPAGAPRPRRGGPGRARP